LGTVLQTLIDFALTTSVAWHCVSAIGPARWKRSTPGPSRNTHRALPSPARIHLAVLGQPQPRSPTRVQLLVILLGQRRRKRALQNVPITLKLPQKMFWWISPYSLASGTMELQVSDLNTADPQQRLSGSECGHLKERILYPRAEAAHQLGISVRTLAEYTKVGEIHPRFLGGKVLYHRSELAWFAKANHASPFKSEASTAAPTQSGPQSASECPQHLAA
jgi:hypothetical protein